MIFPGRSGPEPICDAQIYRPGSCKKKKKKSHTKARRLLKKPHFWIKNIFLLALLSLAGSFSWSFGASRRPLAPPVAGRKVSWTKAERLQTRPELINIKHAKAWFEVGASQTKTAVNYLPLWLEFFTTCQHDWKICSCVAPHLWRHFPQEREAFSVWSWLGKGEDLG